MFDSFIKFETPNITGGYNLAEHHKGWSRISSFEYDLSEKESNFTITKSTDAATPPLYKIYLQSLARDQGKGGIASKNRTIEKITVDICRSGGTKGVERFLAYIFTGCRIRKLSTSITSDGGQTDTLEIAYKTMELRYARTSETSTVDARKQSPSATFSWDFRNNTELK